MARGERTFRRRHAARCEAGESSRWHALARPAVWLANVGYGVLSEEVESYFRRSLEALTAGDHSRALVFYCQMHCWMSWNAAKRALALGYARVHWYPDGTEGWAAAGLPFAEAQPHP